MTTSNTHPVPAPPVPGVWRASDLAPHWVTTPSGFQALDQVLPGGGWPVARLTGLHCPRPGLEWRLLGPALQHANDQGVVLFVAPPHRPHLGALVAMGLQMHNLWWVQAPQPHDMVWALEKALRCEHLAAAVFWPTAHWPGAGWQRLLRACALACGSPPPAVFAVCAQRSTLAQTRAPLQLAVASLGGAGLQVTVHKRPGPPLAHPLVLHAPLVALPAPARQNTTHSATGSPTSTPDKHTHHGHVVDRLHTHTTHLSTTA